MTLPTAVFIDTSVLAGQQYNFESAALSSFVPVASARKLTVLLPDATKREITRQITDRSLEALRALENARRRAPFLAKWKSFPNLPESRHGDWEVKRVALSELKAFLGRLSVKELGYDGVRVETVMGWYDTATAPFGTGKKRKEFPDAFAIAAVAAYAQSTDSYVAVVSEDGDLKLACDRYPRLLYFESLPALTELLLAEETAVEGVKAVVAASQETLEEAIFEEAGQLHFYHANEKYDDIDEVEWDDLYMHAVRVVALGGTDCTVTFEAELHLSTKLRWRDFNYYDDEYRHRSERIHDACQVSGTAKVKFTPDRRAIAAVTSIELDQSDAELTSEP